jgi:hypothetical protein
MKVQVIRTLKKIKRSVTAQSRPVFTQQEFPAKNPENRKTLLVVCGRTFNQNYQNAETLMRVGFANGWAEACGPAKLVPIDKLMREIELQDNPAILLGVYELDLLDFADAKRLRNTDLFVWVSPHPRAHRIYERSILGADQSVDGEVWLRSYGKVIMAEPKFVWNTIGKAGFEWYQGWADDGFRWETIFPGVDTARYYPDPAPKRFGHIKMAYVGGYWAEKAQGFDSYLRPWEDILVPYGYSVWPYKNYGGKLDEAGERQLYSTAGLIPLVHGPYGWLNADVTERYVKAPACRAFCIADHNPGFREAFTEEEVLQAENPEHFHYLVREMLANRIDRDSWAQKGYLAAISRHTYVHRALQIIRALENSGPVDRSKK